MITTHGTTRTFGSTDYGCSGMSSAREAVENVYSRAFENGDWSPPVLRQKWWQFWRPKRHDLETQIFIDANPDWQQQ